jgi:uncharacterized protein YegJ (DUF2314 family)
LAEGQLYKLIEDVKKWMYAFFGKAVGSYQYQIAFGRRVYG